MVATRRATDLDLGFLIREPADVYHAKSKDRVTSHWLADFRRCPLLYHRKRTGLISMRDSATFLLGRAAHTLILEGRARYETEYAVGGPINSRTGKPFSCPSRGFPQPTAFASAGYRSVAPARIV